MLRLSGGQVESLWDEVLPGEVRELPEDLAALDVLLRDAALTQPIAARWRGEAIAHGRPTIPMEVYVCLMIVKQRTGWGYETLVGEVSDSLHLRRFCLIALGERAPHESTVRKLTRTMSDTGAHIRQRCARVNSADARSCAPARGPVSFASWASLHDAEVRFDLHPPDADGEGIRVKPLVRGFRERNLRSSSPLLGLLQQPIRLLRDDIDPLVERGFREPRDLEDVPLSERPLWVVKAKNPRGGRTGRVEGTPDRARDADSRRQGVAQLTAKRARMGNHSQALG